MYQEADLLVQSALQVMQTRGISESGAWFGNVTGLYILDHQQASAIAQIVHGRVLDLGCGRGLYVRELLKRNIDAWELGGHPQAETISEGRCSHV